MVDFINFNELERSDTQAEHYKLDARGYKQRGSISYGVQGSREMAITLLTYAWSKGLSGHFCTAQLKDSVQMRQRLRIRASHAALPFDECTEEGLLLRGIPYVPTMVPGVAYKEKLKTANREVILPELTRLLRAVEKMTQAVLDEKKLRLIAPPAFVKKNATKIKKMRLVPAMVEEYPTEDALDVTIEFF